MGTISRVLSHLDFLSRTQIIAAVGAVLLVLFVLDLVRRRRLSEEFSLLWVASTVAIAALGFATPLLRFMTRALGIMFESSTVFLAGLAFAVGMLLYLSVRMSRMAETQEALTRELALLRSELERRDAGTERG
jgi:hypothetical protein